ncbi:hypothetical protein CLV56_3997 [Mumia flava]|uniref:Holin n=1 Tax=Mumia flava TaxID=1348852 RepID=A0A0B2BN96_9ACTN|nr:hypothetical protein [Mumia flava]PJJ48292.1 hypothetical protein CLV56_3997 [Mumia flava]
MNLETLKPVAKALVGASIATLTALGTALADDHVTTAEWVTVALAGLGTLYGVWRVPNAKAKSAAQS